VLCLIISCDTAPYDEKYGHDNNNNTFNIIIQYNIYFSHPFIVFFAGKSRVTGAWSFTRNITTFSSTKRVSRRVIILTYVLLYAGLVDGFRCKSLGNIAAKKNLTVRSLRYGYILYICLVVLAPVLIIYAKQSMKTMFIGP